MAAVTSFPAEQSRPAPPDRPFIGRGLVPGLLSPAPIGLELPALFQEDDFCQRLTSAFDEVMAPIFATLDCVDSYFDPRLAPEDFVNWLASWVGVEIDETWTLPRRRQLIEDAVALYRVRGTAVGLAGHLGLYAGATPEIEESGGCGWSPTADTELPGSPDPQLLVRLRVTDPEAVNATTVARIVAASRPAHVRFGVEIVADRGELVSGEGSISIDGLTADDGDPAAARLDGEGAGSQPAAAGAGPVGPPGSERVELAAPGPESQEVVEDMPGPDQAPSDGEEPPT